ncbi:MAG: hypothetical protein R6V67_07610, partial [Spirochaetia bacterium]
MPTFLRILLSIGILLLLSSCGDDAEKPPKPEDEQEEESAAAEASVEEEELDSIDVPEFEHALVTFIAGDAWKIADGEETFIDIGDYLEVDDTLQVDTGYVEL